MHLSEGEFQALYDQELSPGEAQRLQAHLAACPGCQSKAEIVLARKQHIGVIFTLLDDGIPQKRPSLKLARARLQARRQDLSKEKNQMSNRWYNRVPRLVWAVGIVLVVLAIAMAFAPVRAVANSFLGLFRVQQIEVVQVNPGALPEQLGDSSQFDTMLSQDVQFNRNGEEKVVANGAEASSLTGIPVRLPQGMSGAQLLSIQPGGNATLTVSLEHMRAILAEIGRADIQLPDGLDGAQVRLDVSPGVLAQYGKCEFDPEQARLQGYDPDDQRIPRLPKCTTFMQMPSPTITAPPELDVQKIGEAYLQVMGMSREEAEGFARNIDWTSTFVLPIPRYGASYQQTPVDGVTGTLIIQDHGGGPDNQYMLIWVKDGIIYALTGPGDAATALRIAGSLQ